MRIVLASESPFRKRAMDLVGVPYETCPSAIDEKAFRHDDPAVLTRTLAEAKARKVAAGALGCGHRVGRRGGCARWAHFRRSRAT